MAPYPFQQVVTETPPADLFMSPAASAFKNDGVRRATSLYISLMVYMIITQTRCTMALFFCGDFAGKTPPSVYFRLTAPVKNLAPLQNAKSYLI